MVIRRRLIFWLFKEYLRKWGKRIAFFFFVGLAVFVLLLTFSNFFISKIPVGKKETIGISGTYTLENLPPDIVSKVSRGLTVVEQNGTVKKGLADSWQIKDNGKTYVFKLKENTYFSDGTTVDAGNINYNFSDVNVERPDNKTLIFKLKDAYAPFLITASSPVFKKGFIGAGDYKILDVRQNGDFVKSITLSSVKNKYEVINYLFYPTTDSLKTAYTLGEVSSAIGLSDLDFKNTKINSFANTNIKKNVNYSKLVTLFYNTSDKVLSDKKARNGLSYALPSFDKFGEEAISLYPSSFWTFRQAETKREENIQHAKLLLQASLGEGKWPEINMKVLPKYREVAEKIVKEWEKIGIKTKIEEVNSLPSGFQIFLGDFNIPKDPDQYTLWHSDQTNNITNYKNLRIDKLLEDGRKTIDSQERKKIYDDLQKYLIDDQPAAFLYFPTEYTITRK